MKRRMRQGAIASALGLLALAPTPASADLSWHMWMELDLQSAQPEAERALIAIPLFGRAEAKSPLAVGYATQTACHQALDDAILAIVADTRAGWQDEGFIPDTVRVVGHTITAQIDNAKGRGTIRARYSCVREGLRPGD